MEDEKNKKGQTKFYGKYLLIPKVNSLTFSVFYKDLEPIKATTPLPFPLTSSNPLLDQS